MICARRLTALIPLRHSARLDFSSQRLNTTTAFGAFGILKDKKATCYPGMEAGLHCAEVLYDSVVTDGKVITSRGMGTAIDFGLKLVEILTDQDTSEKLAAAIVYK